MKMLTEFYGTLACPLAFGHSLVLVGKTIDGAARFHVNVRSGKPSDFSSNIGFRLSCYFRDSCIVRNSFVDGQWGEEETIEHLDDNAEPNPIVQGEFFMICIFCSDDKFHVSINNQPFCTFDYRVPLETLETVEIRDHIQVIKQFDHRTAFPCPWPPIQASDFPKSFSNDIPILFTPGHVIVLKAICYENRKGSFILKFQDRDTKREELHFNPRFEHRMVVRNSMKANFDFGPEEREGPFPFLIDQEFRLAIAFTDKEFRFAIDGYEQLPPYAYRNQNPLEYMVGMKIVCLNGLKMDVTGIYHIHLDDPQCDGFESYSSPFSGLFKVGWK